MNHTCTYLREMKINSAGVVGGPLLVGRFGALTFPLKSRLAAERSGSKVKWSERSGERDSRKLSWAISGKFCRSALLTCSDHWHQKAGPYHASPAAASLAAGSATRRVQAGSLDVECPCAAVSVRPLPACLCYQPPTPRPIRSFSVQTYFVGYNVRTTKDYR